MKTWPNTIASVGICITTVIGVWLTGDARCLWALLIIPVIYKNL